MPHFRHERRLSAGGVWPVAGVDEAGRGPLAGPVAAAAVVLNPRDLPRGLDDSKKLEPDERERLYEVVLRKALAVAVAFSSASEIDSLNIRQASHLAMRRALNALSLLPAHALIDGDDLPIGLPCPAQALVRGDAICMSIAAASILAKVTRDRLMRRLALRAPQYGFNSHVGYATRAHMDAIRLHGPCPYHRLSFSPFRNPELRLESVDASQN